MLFQNDFRSDYSIQEQFLRTTSEQNPPEKLVKKLQVDDANQAYNYIRLKDTRLNIYKRKKILSISIYLLRQQQIYGNLPTKLQQKCIVVIVK